MPSRTRCATFHWACSLLCFLLFVSGGGCGGPRANQNKKTAKKQDKKQEAVDLKANLPGIITGSGWRIRWNARDPKHPNGKTARVLDADARVGRLEDTDEDTMQLDDVRAKLYREGKPAANVNAAQITASQKQRIIVGTGNVTLVTSNKQYDPITVTADTITWDTRTDKMVAEGHTHIVGVPRKKQTHTKGAGWDVPSLEQNGGRLTTNNLFKDFTID